MISGRKQKWSRSRSISGYWYGSWSMSGTSSMSWSGPSSMSRPY